MAPELMQGLHSVSHSGNNSDHGHHAALKGTNDLEAVHSHAHRLQLRGALRPHRQAHPRSSPAVSLTPSRAVIVHRYPLAGKNLGPP
jgi:hypothetical protein